MRDWLMPEASRLRHGDAANVSKEARGIFLEQRRRSSSERLFRNSCLYLECFTTDKSPGVAVTLTSSNLNVNEDGVIRFVVILRIEYSSKVLSALVDEHCGCSKNLCLGAPKSCVSVRQKNAFYIWHITNHKSQICDCYTQTQMRCGNAPVCTQYVTAILAKTKSILTTLCNNRGYLKQEQTQRTSHHLGCIFL